MVIRQLTRVSDPWLRLIINLTLTALLLHRTIPVCLTSLTDTDPDLLFLHHTERNLTLTTVSIPPV